MTTTKTEIPAPYFDGVAGIERIYSGIEKKYYVLGQKHRADILLYNHRYAALQPRQTAEAPKEVPDVEEKAAAPPKGKKRSRKDDSKVW